MARPTATTPWTLASTPSILVLTNFKSKYAVDWSPFLGKKWTDAGDTAIPVTEWKRLAERSPRSPRPSPHTSWSRRCMTTAPPWAVARSTWTGAWARTWPLHRWWPRATRCACRRRLGRGTFTHRHAVIHDQKREKWDTGTYMPLQNVAENQARLS